MIKALKERYPQTNVVTVDYDPGSSEVNQVNRITLMLERAKESMEMYGKQRAPDASMNLWILRPGSGIQKISNRL